MSLNDSVHVGVISLLASPLLRRIAWTSLSPRLAFLAGEIASSTSRPSQEDNKPARFDSYPRLSTCRFALAGAAVDYSSGAWSRSRKRPSLIHFRWLCGRDMLSESMAENMSWDRRRKGESPLPFPGSEQRRARLNASKTIWTVSAQVFGNGDDHRLVEVRRLKGVHLLRLLMSLLPSCSSSHGSLRSSSVPSVWVRDTCVRSMYVCIYVCMYITPPVGSDGLKLTLCCLPLKAKSPPGGVECGTDALSLLRVRIYPLQPALPEGEAPSLASPSLPSNGIPRGPRMYCTDSHLARKDKTLQGRPRGPRSQHEHRMSMTRLFSEPGKRYEPLSKR
ncbi:hypothetical protein MGYG_03507 [Nannizzia gypsea CBS 118893]|uniref:Uncharacterized protein n=1 Tax=Arthroderma gypseum (strain ATCC MYA-4604 / CBS 118893) TaxID=535722 RepID=E4USD8_ARTGP|nr:hypothetical protein MGYG_03507 [Nannizzia gypsea CBS 118893]EFR00505.1 hypothetical protein MGYG_03507 [Nannizzia gypsea CBS 118893]